MAITYDPAERERTLRERGLDFKDARKRRSPAESISSGMIAATMAKLV
jgi:hypothetical protein